MGSSPAAGLFSPSPADNEMVFSDVLLELHFSRASASSKIAWMQIHSLNQWIIPQCSGF
jgi:hypothetical protein